MSAFGAVGNSCQSPRDLGRIADPLENKGFQAIAVRNSANSQHFLLMALARLLRPLSILRAAAVLQLIAARLVEAVAELPIRRSRSPDRWSGLCCG
ncbi:MAG TPA: hypothetical protein VK509_25975, partial [Polyangiales bacterium]|nr:hypothetical protein [Polyangiales bacterium]